MTDPKYQCLVDAMEKTGIALPPLKSGTFIRSDIKPAYGGAGETAEFRFVDTDDNGYVLYAGRGNLPSSAREEFVGRYRMLAGFPYPPKVHVEPSFTVGVGLDTGVETQSKLVGSPRAFVKSGTSAEATDKLFNCLDPLVF